MLLHGEHVSVSFKMRIEHRDTVILKSTLEALEALR